MVTTSRGVQLCEIAAALALLLLGVAVLIFAHAAADAAKDYERQQVQEYGSGYVESAPPVLPVAQCQRNATGCCDLHNKAMWQSDYVFCDADLCAGVLGDKQLANLCVSEVRFVTDAVHKADSIIAWGVFTSVTVLVLAVVAANSPASVSKPRACCLCCVNVSSLVPMVFALVLAGGLVALLSSASDTAHQQCVYVCKDIHGDPLPKSPVNAGVCVLGALLKGVDCSQGGCCFQSDLDSLATLAASTLNPFYVAICAAVLASLMGCCSLHTCACAQPGDGSAPPAGVSDQSINAPLVPDRIGSSFATSTTLNPR